MHLFRSMMAQNRTFRQFKNSIGAVFRQGFLVAFPVAGIGIQEKVVDIKNSARTQNPENFIPEKLLIRIAGNAGEDRAASGPDTGVCRAG